MTLRVGVVGCGAMAAQFHLPALRHWCDTYDDIQVPWCCDLDADLARAAADRLGAKPVGDYGKALVDHPVDACMVLVGVGHTFGVVRDLLTRKVPVLTEKPPGANLDQARELARLAEDNGVPSQVAFNRRHNPYLAAGMEHVGGRSAVRAVTYEMFRVFRREASYPAYTMIHAIDALRHVGGEPEEWSVYTREDPRGWTFIVRFASGVLATLAVYPDVGIRSERCSLHSAERTAVAYGLHYGTADGLGWAELHERAPLRRRIDLAASWPAELRPVFAHGFLNQVGSFLDSLRAGRSCYPDLTEALKTMEWIDQILTRLGRTWPE